MTLWTAGVAEHGELLLGETTSSIDFAQATVPAGTDGFWVGQNRTMIRVSSTQLYCIGLQSFGECGLGDRLPHTVLTPVSLPSKKALSGVSLGDEHSALLFSDGGLYTAGRNVEGQLGLGDQADRVVFVIAPRWIGPVSQVALGARHSAIITSASRLLTVGSNSVGQLGLGTAASFRSMWEFPALPKGRRPTSVAAGLFHTVVVLDNGAVLTSGGGARGQLGQGQNKTGIVRSFAYADMPSSHVRAVAAFAGPRVTAVLLEDGGLLVCGENTHGQLALGDRVDRFSFVAVALPFFKQTATAVALSETSTAVLLDDDLWMAGSTLAATPARDRLVLDAVLDPATEGVKAVGLADRRVAVFLGARGDFPADRARLAWTIALSVTLPILVLVAGIIVGVVYAKRRAAARAAASRQNVDVHPLLAGQEGVDEAEKGDIVFPQRKTA